MGIIILLLFGSLALTAFGYTLGKRESNDQLKKKLWSMRLTKEQVNKNQEQAYGYTDCINDLCDWIYKK